MTALSLFFAVNFMVVNSQSVVFAAILVALCGLAVIMASPQLSKVKPCSFRGCQVSFSKQDSHSDCYYHRVCQRTRTGGNILGRDCLQCKSWNKEQLRAFEDLRKLREKKIRERAAKPTSLYSPGFVDSASALSFQKPVTTVVGPLTFAEVVTSPPRTAVKQTDPRVAPSRLLTLPVKSTQPSSPTTRSQDWPVASQTGRLYATSGSGASAKSGSSHKRKKSKKSKSESKRTEKTEKTRKAEMVEKTEKFLLPEMSEKTEMDVSSEPRQSLGSDTVVSETSQVTDPSVSEPVVVAILNAQGEKIENVDFGARSEAESEVEFPVSDSGPAPSLSSETSLGIPVSHQSLISSVKSKDPSVSWTADSSISSAKASGLDLKATLEMLVGQMSVLQSDMANLKQSSVEKGGDSRDVTEPTVSGQSKRRSPRRRRAGPRSRGSKRRRVRSPGSPSEDGTGSGSSDSDRDGSGDSGSTSDRDQDGGREDSDGDCDSDRNRDSGVKDSDSYHVSDRDREGDSGLGQRRPVEKSGPGSDEAVESQLDELQERIWAERARLQQKRDLAGSHSSVPVPDRDCEGGNDDQEEQRLLRLLAQGTAAHQQFVPGPPPPVSRSTLSPSSGLPKERVNLDFTIPRTVANRGGRSPTRRPLVLDEASRARSHSPAHRVSFAFSPRKDVSPLRGPLARLVDPQFESRRSQSEDRPSSQGDYRESRSLTPGSVGDVDKFLEKNNQSFREDIKLLLHLNQDLHSAPATAKTKMPECLEGSFDKGSKTRHCLPVHHNVNTWYNFASLKLDEEADGKEYKRSVAFEPQDFLKKCSIYDSGVDGNFLRKERTPPFKFTEISHLKQSSDVKKLMSSSTTLSNEQVKALERSARTGLSAGSYGLHFMDGATAALKELEQKLISLAPPDQCSDNTRHVVKTQRDELLDSMTKVQSFVQRAQTANNIAFGMHTLADVNLTLARRDKFISKMPGYLKKHAFEVRNQRVDNQDLVPNTNQIILEAREDANHEQTRRLAELNLDVAKLSKGQQHVQRGRGQGRQGQGQGRQGQGQGQGRNRNFQRSRGYDRGYDQEYRRDYQPRGAYRGRGGRGRGRSQGRDQDRRSRSRSKEKETK